MFTALHALAQNSTLLIVVTAESDELRVSVTPTQTGDKTTAHKLRPLSLLGTAAELDEGFATALAVWLAPKMSLIEQAQAVADGDDDATDPDAPTGKAPAAKRGRKSNKTGAVPAEQSKDETDSAPTAEGPTTAPAIVAAVDTLTLDLF